MKKLNIVFCGTPEFAIPIVQQLFDNDFINIKYIVSMPDRPAGRGKQLKSPPVANFAKENNIPLLQTPNINKEEKWLKVMEESEVDFIMVLAFAQFLGNKILSLPKLGCFNIHTSLLPKYRGAAPIQYALLNGDTETGITIQKMVKKMDAGDIVMQERVAISPQETSETLFNKLSIESARLIPKFINSIVSDKLEYIVQDESLASFAPSIQKEEGLIDFTVQNSALIINKLKAFFPWPGCFCFLNGKRLKILEAEIFKGKTLSPGQIDITLNHLLVGTADGKTIRLSQIQLEGKRPCADTQLLNGLQGKAILLSPRQEE